jgi:hypothetical protein
MRQLKRKFGIWMLSVGVKLVFTSDKERDNLKHHSNLNSWVGAQIDSGGHILRDLEPMSEYGTQSVINVFRHKLLTDEPERISSIEKTYAKEEWV